MGDLQNQYFRNLLGGMAGGYDSGTTETRTVANAPDAMQRFLAACANADPNSYLGRMAQITKINPQRAGQTNMAGRQVGGRLQRVWQ